MIPLITDCLRSSLQPGELWRRPKAWPAGHAGPCAPSQPTKTSIRVEACAINSPLTMAFTSRCVLAPKTFCRPAPQRLAGVRRTVLVLPLVVRAMASSSSETLDKGTPEQVG